MRNSKKGFIWIIFLALCSSVWAAVPQLVNLQGSLRDAGGSPVRNQTVSVVFKIYDAAVGGSTQWTETQNVSTDNEGSFNVTLGSVTPIPDAAFSGPDRWLGIKVGADPEMTPRLRLVSNGYTYRVNSVDEATGGDIRGNLYLHSTLQVGDGLDAGYINMTNGASFTTHIGGKDVSDNDNGAVLKLDNSGNNTTIHLNADDYQASDVGGRLTLGDGTSNTIELDAYDFGTGALLVMTDGVDTTVTLDARSGGAGAYFEMTDGTRKTVHLDANGVSGGAQLSLIDSDGETTFSLDAESGVDGGARMELLDGTSVPSKTTIILDAQSGTGAGALLTLRDAAGTDQIYLDANWGGTGRSRIVTDEMQINGGADLSEQFDVQANTGKLEQGMVVSIDPENPGKLVVSTQPYDRKVAGILSGAGNVRPGMLMGQPGSEADGEYPVALTGRVYCWADASHGAIQPGDLLTTSDTSGHAMKVTDYKKAQGAIIGKAMTGLEKGRGLVLVLVSLQ